MSIGSGPHLGVDVGGTNTDAVVVEGGEVVCAAKTPTTEDVTTGIVAALDEALAKSDLAKEQVSAVMIGTTHFTNAIVEGRGLLPTAILRLCGQATRAVPPLTDWPVRLRAVVEGAVFLTGGGHEYDGRVISPLDHSDLEKTAAAIREAGLSTAAITSVFSPVDDTHEREAADLLRDLLPDLEISLSSEIGSIGLVERENATVINSSLRGLARRIVGGLEEAISSLGLTAPVYLSQNDGTLMDSDYTRRYPVATFASGPTNSMRGAAWLSGLGDCAVIDIGGTTTDVGMLVHGFPRQSSVTVDVSGVRTNFRMPDVVSTGIGGGSIVAVGDEVTVGPESVGYRITERAMVFGGDVLTATDVAVAGGLAEIGHPALVEELDPGIVRDALAYVAEGIGEVLDLMKTGPEPVPVVMVGGGSVIVDHVPGASQLTRPSHFPVANAVGAAIAEIGGQVDRIVSLDETPREEALRMVSEEAMERAIAAGARRETVTIVDIDEIPLAYLPSNAVRLKVKAVGELG